MVKTFENVELGKVDVIMIKDEPHFIGKQVATVLGYSDTDQALRRHVDAEDKQTLNLNTLDENNNPSKRRGNPNTMLINESGMYSLILSSKLENAKKFKRWVTSEVLPSIRKTGSYGTAPAPAAPYVLIPKFFRGKQVITVKDAAVILNTSRSLIESIINKPTGNIQEGKDYYRLKGDKRAEVKNENPSVPAAVHHIIDILESGFKKICDYMLVETPPIFRVENLETYLPFYDCCKYSFRPTTNTDEMLYSYSNARRILFVIRQIYREDRKIVEECNDLLAILMIFIREKNLFGAPIERINTEDDISAKAV